MWFLLPLQSNHSHFSYLITHRSSKSSTEERERKKPKKNPVPLQLQPPTPKGTKDSKPQKRNFVETSKETSKDTSKETSKEASNSKDSGKHKRSSGKNTEHPHSEKVTAGYTISANEYQVRALHLFSVSLLMNYYIRREKCHILIKLLPCNPSRSPQRKPSPSHQLHSRPGRLWPTDRCSDLRIGKNPLKLDDWVNSCHDYPVQQVRYLILSQ